MSKSEQKEAGLSIQHRNILNAVPIGVYWSIQRIITELHRTTGSKPEHRNVSGVLQKLCEDGLCRIDAQGHYQQTRKQATPVVTQIAKTIKTAKEKSTAMERIALIGAALTAKQDEFSMFVKQAREELDDIALELGQGKQMTEEELKQLEQFRQFKAMLAA